MASHKIDLGRVGIASTYKFIFSISKDGVAWSGIETATLILKDPDGIETAKTMLLLFDSTGTWYYETTVTDILKAGRWSVGLHVTQGSIDVTYEYEITFNAFDQP